MGISSLRDSGAEGTTVHGEVPGQDDGRVIFSASTRVHTTFGPHSARPRPNRLLEFITRQVNHLKIVSKT